MNDGGPAFPRPIGHNGLTHHEEHESSDAEDGMSLRDYLAATAMPALLTGDTATPWATIAKCAYEIADAMLKARDQR
jgi:hypothetical protein